MLIEKRTFLVGIVSVFALIVGMICNSALAFWCIATVLFLLCIYTGYRENKIINPYYLFAITPFTLLIYTNVSSKYMQDLEMQTWLIALLNIATFTFAMLLTPAAKTRSFDKKRGLEHNSLEFHAVFLSIVGIGPILLYELTGIAIPFYTIFGLLSVPALCCAIASKKKKLFFYILIFTLLTWLSNVSKSSVLTTCLCLIICYEFYLVFSKKERRKLLLFCLIGVIVILLSFTFANQVRNTGTAMDQLNYYVKYGNVQWKGPAALFMPYMYLETPWSNLQYVMQTQDTRTYGLWLVKPFLNYLQLDRFFERMYQLIPMSSFNTFSFIACNFKDFGFGGSVIPSALLGCYVKWVYTRAYQTKNPLDVACYVYVARAVLEMFFSNHFFQQAYPLTCVLMLELYKIFFTKVKINLK